MQIEFITQPTVQLGNIILSNLSNAHRPTKVIFVSAFIGLQTIYRCKEPILNLGRLGSSVRFVIGIDMGGTSQEVLQEILSWGIDASIVKNRTPRHTFHPKLYLFEWHDHAEIFIGSNNLTEGGFFGNYENSARIIYTLPTDQIIYDSAIRDLRRFIEPSGPVVYTLTEVFLRRLIALGQIPNEATARRNRRDIAAQQFERRPLRDQYDAVFGTEDIVNPPPLPAQALARLISRTHTTRRQTGGQRTRQTTARRRAQARTGLTDTIAPISFYMTLPTLQGPTLPGEGRIPLGAIELAREFWGWPDEYSRTASPRGGIGRSYLSWSPTWRIWNVATPANIITQNVRMYFYENSKDFRFYARPLVSAGANIGDVVRITRLAQHDVEFECVLARVGTHEYDEWITYCTQSVPNSTRRFGFV